MTPDSAQVSAGPILQVHGLRAGYGSGWTLQKVDLSVGAGELVGLFAPNGYGKTTLLNALGGLLQHVQGEILLEGRNLALERPHLRARAGLRLVPESRELFPEQTVLANLHLGGYLKPLTVRRQIMEEALDILPLIKPLLARTVGTLSGGEQQAVAIARALMGQPKVLLLDEFSWGLAPVVVQRLIEALVVLAGKGIGVLATDQHVAYLGDVVQRGYYLKGGMLESLERSNLQGLDQFIEGL